MKKAIIYIPNKSPMQSGLGKTINGYWNLKQKTQQKILYGMGKF
jgi:hypothetical protein